MTLPTQVFIVTPSFNAAETIERTIVSVLSQAGEFNLFYHVQDGGSKDATVEILKKWQGIVEAGTFPVFCRSVSFSFESVRDEGLYDAIVRGFDRFAIGDESWLGWINADDLLVPGTCATLSLIDETPDQRHIGIVVGSAGVLSKDAIIASAPRPVSTAVVREGLCDGRHWNFIQQEGLFFRNLVWRSADVARNFRGLKYAGDWNLLRIMAQHHEIYQVDRPLGLFRIREGQISQQFRSEYDEEAELLVPSGKKTAALRQLARGGGKRSVLRFQYPTGRVSSIQEDVAWHAKTWYQKRLGAVHDADWQFPAITERQAFRSAYTSFPVDDNNLYLAFPWATLIDRAHNKAVGAEALASALNSLVAQYRKANRIITVCQHVRMLSHRDLFERAKVTDVFWSHATKGVRVWPGKQPITIHPFPLYPVQMAEAAAFQNDEQRPHLFSFAGAVANTWYLSEVRDWILRDLASDPRGVVIGREGWHYDKIVYGHQIKGSNAPIEKLTDQAASEEFKRLLRDSTFALCPSGSGPNSIRLWEAIGAGSIPVILADSYAPPGDKALWEAAAVFCPETEEAVNALPDRLAAMAADPALIAQKRHALRQLWMLYGPDNFIHDLRRFAFTTGSRAFAEARARPTAEAKTRRLRIGLLGRHSNRTPLSYPAYAAFFAGRVEVVKKLENADILVTGFDIDFRENMETVARLQKQNPSLKLAVISEEPLWDTLWAAGFREKTLSLSEKGQTIRYAAINHTNSDIFEFGSIPYFVTTTDEYAARYNYLFARNAELTAEAVLDRWQKAPIPAAFYAEKRTDPKYAKAHPDLGIHGLSGYRSELAALVGQKGVLRVGQGWGDAPKRQSLPDWHLDKLASLDRRTRLVSAIENTHQRSYVTEKLFDAFAVGGVPLYWAAKDHGVHRLVSGGFLNLHGKTPREAADAIRDWKPDLAFAGTWLEAQRELSARFSDPMLLARERSRLADQLIGHLEQIAQGDWPDLAAGAAEVSRQPEQVRAAPASPPVPEVAVTTKQAPPTAPAKPAAEKVLMVPVGSVTSQNGKSPSVATRQAGEPKTPRPAPAPRKPLAKFTAANVVETVSLKDGYRHINIRLTGLAHRGVAVAQMYFKVQHLRDEQYGLQFVRSDTSTESAIDWTDENGGSLDRLNLFFGLGSALVWSAKPGTQLEQMARSVMAALPDILESCDFAAAKIQPEPWGAVLAAAERLSA